MVVDNMVQTKW